MSPLFFISFDIIAGILGSLHFMLQNPLYSRIQNTLAKMLTRLPASWTALTIASAIVTSIIIAISFRGLFIDLEDGTPFVRANTIWVTMALALGCILAVSVIVIITRIFHILSNWGILSERSIPFGVLAVAFFSIFLFPLIGSLQLFWMSFILGFVIATLLLGLGMNVAWYTLSFLTQEQDQLMVRAGVLVFLAGKLTQLADYVNLIQSVNNLL